MKSPESVENSGLAFFHPVFTSFETPKAPHNVLSDTQSHSVVQKNFKFLRNEFLVGDRDGFCIAISLHDATTLYVTGNTATLGYPKNMLIGQSFVNFLYPRDKITFASQLAQSLQSRFDQKGKVLVRPEAEKTFFCRIRLYHGLKHGFSVIGNKAFHKPFQLMIKDTCTSFGDNFQDDPTCLLVFAIPIASAYRIPEEIPAMSSFSTRHTPACYFSHIDSGAIPYLGFLPQDVLGLSVFDFYNPVDMPLLKTIYELVMEEQGSSFLSKPYGFKVANGCYITLETEWSCFINPWSHKLEFVVGQHRVLKGPTNPDLFSEINCQDGLYNHSTEVCKESLKIQEEIKALLAQPVRNQSNVLRKKRCLKRKRDLASCVIGLIDELHQERKCHAPYEDATGKNTSMDCSVTMGHTSSTHQIADSERSSNASMSSQEMRYHENIDRFFSSYTKANGFNDTGSGFMKQDLLCLDDEKFKYCGTSVQGLLDTITSNPKDKNIESHSTENYPPYVGLSLTEDALANHNRMTKKMMKERRAEVYDRNKTQKEPDLESRTFPKLSKMSESFPTVPVISWVPLSIKSSFSIRTLPVVVQTTPPIFSRQTPTFPKCFPRCNDGSETKLSNCMPAHMPDNMDTTIGSTCVQSKPARSNSSFRPVEHQVQKLAINHSEETRKTDQLDLDLTSRPRRGQPWWMADIEMTPEIVFGLQLTPPPKEDVLSRDLMALRAMSQSDIVTEQLELLQNQLEAKHKRKQSGVASSDDELYSECNVDLGFGIVKQDEEQEVNEKEEELLHQMGENM